jgi:hypothetical protein
LDTAFADLMPRFCAVFADTFAAGFAALLLEALGAAFAAFFAVVFFGGALSAPHEKVAKHISIAQHSARLTIIW